MFRFRVSWYMPPERSPYTAKFLSMESAAEAASNLRRGGFVGIEIRERVFEEDDACPHDGETCTDAFMRLFGKKFESSLANHQGDDHGDGVLFTILPWEEKQEKEGWDSIEIFIGMRGCGSIDKVYYRNAQKTLVDGRIRQGSVQDYARAWVLELPCAHVRRHYQRGLGCKLV